MLFAFGAHGTSWLLLAFIAARGEAFAFNPATAAWIHLVALGWFSMAALGVLIHVIPGFTDLRWTFENLARWSLAGFGLGVVFFVVSWLALPSLIAASALFVGVTFAAYFIVASLTLAKGRTAPRTERAIARALWITLGIFCAVVVLGVMLALSLDGWAPAAWLVRLAPAHASLALYGWLTLLVFGVSARTIGPISGARSRRRWVHIVVGACALVGTLALALGLGTAIAPFTFAGALFVGVAAAFYLADVADTLRRATVPHRPPQAFVAAALVWLGASTVAGAGVMFGEPWQAPYIFLILVGWIGQMLNAHIHHIGVRLIATIYRGEDDETRPAELLDARLSWLGFGEFQAAVVLCGAGLFGVGSAYVTVGALLGFVGWCTMLANLNGARRRSQQPPRVYDLLNA